MFLRSLVVRGFKSFAAKTVLEFGPGVSVIVGPNGSGKSNLVDAISWVLGEQGPTALRGSQMADVIFAGGAGRSRLGMAEVSLLIDNAEGLIPVPASEIEISRTIWRSGESQYAIGGRPCRLLDILEILSDTGIGRGLHTVIGQGHLEDVLTARPEERRRFIEEAAGIAKHRRRKERAQRKLASLEQDLLRLHDVMAELKRQLRPLRRQAEAADKHRALTDEAESLAWRASAARLRDLYAEREARRPAWERGLAHRREAEERLAALDAEIARVGERQAGAEEALEAAERDHTAAVEERSRAEAALRKAVRLEGEARARVAADRGRSGRLFTLEEEAQRTEAALAETLAALEAREAALEEAEREFRAAERARRDAEEAQRRAHEAALARRAEVGSLRRSLESAQGEAGRLAEELRGVARREAAARAERETLDLEVERLDAEETPLADRQRKLTGEREQLLAQLDELEDAERRVQARREALEARRRALSETPGSRFLPRARRAIGLLGRLVRAEDGMAEALAAALGPLADAVVYEDHGQAVAESPRAGGATLAVVEGASGGYLVPGERSLRSHVRADPRVEALVASALRDVYVARDPEEALAKHRRHPAASFVTPGGVLVGPGLVRTAPVSRDRDEVRREDHLVSRDLAGVRRRLAALRDRLGEIEDALSEVREALDQRDARITAAADRMASLGADLTASERERQVLEERLSSLDETLRSSRETLAAMGPEPDGPGDLPPHPEAPVAQRVEVEALRRERTRLEAGLARCRAQLEDLRASDPPALREAAEGAEAAREAAESDLKETEARAAETAERRERAAGEAAEARAAASSANEAWRAAAGALQRLRDEYEEEDRARGDLERRIREAEGVLRDGHGTDPAEAVGSLGEDDTPASLERRANLVARRLGLLGRVNLVASEEYQALQERHDFLEREIDDVKVARRHLQEVVREVDGKIAEIFDAAFRDVAAEFSAVIGTLFPGGEGTLSLTDPEDLLGTGVEVRVRPGGKRVRRLSLLSGGERSLAALGFLFAIFRARPSPFYLLDEVDDALDDVNLHRFLELIADFARTSQVILVTHQKRTMEAADVLYGVSMGSGGASTVISQRVSEAVAAEGVRR